MQILKLVSGLRTQIGLETTAQRGWGNGRGLLVMGGEMGKIVGRGWRNEEIGGHGWR